MARPIKYDDNHILDRASDLLWLQSPDSVTIRDLETALDLKAPSIYRRFRDREQLIACTIDRYVERVVAGRIRDFLDQARDPIAGLRAFFTSALDPVPGETLPRGCLLTLTAGQSAFAHPEIRSSVTAGLAAIEDGFRRTLRRAQHTGQLTGDADVDTLATNLLMAFEGLLVLARSGHRALPGSVEQLFAGLPAIGHAVTAAG
jgi:TetR/AcrR family transcriptional repressor of nem operon